MPHPFDYPKGLHIRKHGPWGYSAYQTFKPWLRDEFDFRCVYCLCREMWDHDGHNSWGADHLAPKSKNPEGENEYDNLVYACNQCNSLRNIGPKFDPCEVDFSKHLEVQGDGRIVGLSPTGNRLIEEFRLDREDLRSYRERYIIISRKMEGIADKELRAEFEKLMGYPPELPNLKKKRPKGNKRRSGLTSSAYERRQRGNLPNLY